ncbi:MAG: glycosyltransferase family 4 protein [Hyphomicrobiaceae bacterium]
MVLPTSKQPQKTVAVILKGYPRLSETFIAQELLGLERAGYALRLFSMRRPTDAKLHPVHREIRAPVVYLPEYLHEAPLRVARALWQVSRQPGFRTAFARFVADFRRDPTRNRIRRFGQAAVLAAELPDDVGWLYAHFIHTPAAVTRHAALMTGLAWSCSAHAKDIWTSPDWDLTESLVACRWVATCTAVGHDHLARLAADAGASGSVNLVYHGLDLARFPRHEAASVGPLRDGYDPAHPVRILCVGRAVAKKGIDTLLRALAMLPTDLAWRFEHIGGGGELAGLRRLAESLGIADRVIWRGAEEQSAVLAAYRASDLFVLPCRIAGDGDRDGLPNVLVEAQSQRLACISTTVSAVPELIEDGVTGRLVPPDDAAVLAEAIKALGRDPAARRAMGDAGEARVRAAFDHAACLDRLLRLFPLDLAGESRATTSVNNTACRCRMESVP